MINNVEAALSQPAQGREGGMIRIVSDHGFPKGDGSHPDDDPFDLFKNERDHIAQSGRMKTTVAAMDWAAGEIERMRVLAFKYLQEVGKQAAPPHSSDNTEQPK